MDRFCSISRLPLLGHRSDGEHLSWPWAKLKPVKSLSTGGPSMGEGNRTFFRSCQVKSLAEEANRISKCRFHNKANQDITAALAQPHCLTSSTRRNKMPLRTRSLWT